jgi:hypothetical protein
MGVAGGQGGFGPGAAVGEVETTAVDQAARQARGGRR